MKIDGDHPNDSLPVRLHIDVFLFLLSSTLKRKSELSSVGSVFRIPLFRERKKFEDFVPSFKCFLFLAIVAFLYSAPAKTSPGENCPRSASSRAERATQSLDSLPPAPLSSKFENGKNRNWRAAKGKLLSRRTDSEKGKGSSYTVGEGGRVGGGGDRATHRAVLKEKARAHGTGKGKREREERTLVWARLSSVGGSQLSECHF